MKASLHGRLLVALGLTVLAAWSATAFFSFLDARSRIGTMLDDHLVQAANLLSSHRASENGQPDPPLRWGPAEEGHTLVYQGFDDHGRLVFRSSDAPRTSLADLVDGFSEVERSGVRWRVYTTTARDGTLRLQVAEHAGFRSELAASVARHLLHPVAIAIPILALLIWLAVRWGLAPLQSLARDVTQREPHSLVPLDPRGAPSEARPLVIALDTLFSRVAALVEKERRFTADAAHELRTPLAAIQTHAEVALASRAGDEVREALAHVIEGTQRASRLVEQLLVLARLDARSAPPPSAHVPLAALVAQKIAEAAPLAARRRINLGLEEADDARVTGDADLLGVLVRNLVDNAVRYVEPGGRVDVLVRADGERVTLTVADDGPGIPAEARARVLERFYRARQSDEDGSGLGLSIVARIAELHRAPLTLSSGIGERGLGVRISLPRAKPAGL